MRTEAKALYKFMSIRSTFYLIGLSQAKLKYIRAFEFEKTSIFNVHLTK